MVSVSRTSLLRRSRRAITLALAGAATVVPATDAGAGRSIYQSKLLWATVNVCDTKDQPDAIGIRGSMPGSGIAGERMYMRFQVQWFSAAAQAWRNIGPSGDSGFVRVGSARFKVRQAGRSFVVPPPRTGAFRLRGAVTFEWRKDGEVVRRARKRTTSGHGSTPGADPAGYSAASCDVTLVA